MINITTKELEIDNELKNKIEFICDFCNAKPIIINGNIPFDTYKVIRNGNCIITSNLNELNISNKHNAIVFYKNNIPVRLMVINQNTDIDNCINVALSQQFNDFALNEIYKKLAIKRYDIDLRQQPIHNNSNKENEIDVGSCDRPSLLNCMLDG